jgi:hypothetical protein
MRKVNDKRHLHGVWRRAYSKCGVFIGACDDKQLHLEEDVARADCLRGASRGWCRTCLKVAKIVSET